MMIGAQPKLGRTALSDLGAARYVPDVNRDTGNASGTGPEPVVGLSSPQNAQTPSQHAERLVCAVLVIERHAFSRIRHR